LQLILFITTIVGLLHCDIAILYYQFDAVERCRVSHFTTTSITTPQSKWRDDKVDCTT